MWTLKQTYSAKLKTTKVILSHDKGDESNYKNYRTISLFKSTEKKFEKLLDKRLMIFCNEETYYLLLSMVSDRESFALMLSAK